MIQVNEITEVVKAIDIVAKFLADITKTEMSVKDVLKRCENRQQDIQDFAFAHFFIPHRPHLRPFGSAGNSAG